MSLSMLAPDHPIQGRVITLILRTAPQINAGRACTHG